MSGAALPEEGYKRPITVLHDGQSVVVKVFAEQGGAERSYRFHRLNLGIELETALAEGFARATGPGGTRRTVSSAENLYSGIRAFAGLVNVDKNPARALDELRPAHLAPIKLRGTKHSYAILIAVRVAFRVTPGLPAPFRKLLYAPHRVQPSGKTISSYSDSEFRAIRRSARSEIRGALERVRGAEAELAAWEAGLPEGGDAETTRRGKLFAFIARTGDVPRYDDGHVSRRASYLDSPQLNRALFPTMSEMAAIVVLMQCLTGQNLSTVCQLSTDYLRADSQSEDDQILLTRAQKPRRGRYGADMDLSFSSVPVWLDNGGDKDGDDFSSPFGLYMIAEELCRRARGFTGTTALICGYADRRRETTVGGLGFREVKLSSPQQWEWVHDGITHSSVSTMRLRRAFLERYQHPVAQSTETLANTYLSKDPGSLATYQRVVGDALAEEVERIKASNAIRTLTDEDVRDAAGNPNLLADQLGISVGKLTGLLEGRLDTIATACVDHDHGPHTTNGQPCTASFLLCLSCPNARSEPRHIPVQALLSKRIHARQLEMPKGQWDRRFLVVDQQLTDLLQQQHADVDQMAQQASDGDLQIVEALLDGRYDIR